MVVVRPSYKKFHKIFHFLFATVFFPKNTGYAHTHTHHSIGEPRTHRTKNTSSAFTAPLEIKETHKNDKSRMVQQYGPHTKNIFFMHRHTTKNSTFLLWFLPKIMVSVLGNAHTKYTSVFVEKRLFFNVATMRILVHSKRQRDSIFWRTPFFRTQQIGY